MRNRNLKYEMRSSKLQYGNKGDKNSWKGGVKWVYGGRVVECPTVAKCVSLKVSCNSLSGAVSLFATDRRQTNLRMAFYENI
ncbi:MAG: hypothetical protein ABIL69_08830 [candidate division WOR-3 bacterium]